MERSTSVFIDMQHHYLGLDAACKEVDAYDAPRAAMVEKAVNKYSEIAYKNMRESRDDLTRALRKLSNILAVDTGDVESFLSSVIQNAFEVVEDALAPHNQITQVGNAK